MIVNMLSDEVYTTRSTDVEIRVAAVLFVEKTSQLLEAACGSGDIIVHFAYPRSSDPIPLISLRVVARNSSTHYRIIGRGFVFLRKQSNLFRSHCTQETVIDHVSKRRTRLHSTKTQPTEDAMLSLQILLTAAGTDEHVGTSHYRLPGVETVLINGLQHAVVLMPLIQDCIHSAALALATHLLYWHLLGMITIHLATNPLRLGILPVLVRCT